VVVEVDEVVVEVDDVEVVVEVVVIVVEVVDGTHEYSFLHSPNSRSGQLDGHVHLLAWLALIQVLHEQ